MSATTSPDIKANAALSICESLLLCLADLKVLTARQVVDLLNDAAAAHRNAAADGEDAALNLAVADLIDGVRRSGGPAE